MSRLILVTGGARSGKSRFAESLCRERNNATAYIATSIPFDEELSKESTTNSKNSEIIQEALKEILFRLNLPAGRKI